MDNSSDPLVWIVNRSNALATSKWTLSTFLMLLKVA